MAETPVVTALEAVKESKPRTCIIEQALPSSVIQLLKAAPQNDTILAVVLAHLNQPIPKEHATYEAIKEWIETTIVKAKPEKSSSKDTAIVYFAISGSEREYGTCLYSVTKQGSGDVGIPLAEFREMMANAEDLDELRDAVADYISENWLAEISMSAEDEYDYCDHEASGSEDQEWEYEENIVTKLRTLVREHGDEDARERLQ